MMRSVLRAASLAFTLALLSGCGTIANFNGRSWRSSQIYGGVLRDVKSEQDWIANNPIKPETDIMKDVGTVVGVGLIGIDFPLSAIADTLTLPLTIPAALLPPPPPPAAATNAASVSRKDKGSAPAAKPVSPASNTAQK